MYQSFTGQSRRPRQVNLSGRPSNPFAAASQNAGPQSTIASAQHERLQRQLQRERIQASGRIQRVWRGHRARRRAFESWREIWDAAEEQPRSEGVYASAEESLSQLNRLLLFYSPSKEPSDIKRLGWYGMKQIATSEKTACAEGRWPQAYAKLRQACLVALKAKGHSEDPQLYRTVLNVLAFAANPLKRSTEMNKVDALAYYETLTSLDDAPDDALQNALIAPLGTEGGYAGIAVLLGHPLSPQMLSLLKSAVHRPSLIQALSQAHDLQWSARSRLWLLGNLNFLCGRSRIGITTTIARLLGSLADEVDFEGAPLDMENVAFDRDILAKTAIDLPLNTYLYEQTSSLVNQESVRNLLVRNNRADDSYGNSGTTNAQLYANYALTLLRCFPRKADDIRMWLYLGPTESHDVPATRFFWNAAKLSSVFSTVSKDSRAVVPLLRSLNAVTQKDDWTIILVFLELYTFLLKIMDDEEFMGKSVGGPESAIPIEDVAVLVTFLKNLGFTLYFNAAELNEHAMPSARDTGSLSSHFGGHTSAEPLDDVETKPLTLAGMPGMTADYLKGIATALLRSIYERDSRRHFLPTNHWLMTSRFDMTAFIPGVVAEEENRHRLAEQEEEDKGDEDSDDDLFDISPRGPASHHRSQEARARAQRKVTRRRYLESVAPRLEILQNMPFFIPFHTRVEIFRHFVHLDQAKRRNGLVDPDTWRANMMFAPQEPGRNMLARHHAQIKRKSEFEDAYQAFYDLGTDLKEPIQITFLDEFGLQEAGIDGGGVTKEFLTSVINQAFDPANAGLEKYFIENEKHLLFPNPTALDDARVALQDTSLSTSDVNKELREMLRKFEFLGRIIGKCLYEEILVDVSFAGFFLKKWALTGGHGSAPGESGYRANINDLRDFDEALYKGLLDVKLAADASDYGLTFTIDDLVGPAGKKQVIERELIPNGADTPVTNENRLIYLNRMSWYRLQGQSAPQTNAFLKGLSSIVQPSWLSMFNQAELQTLIGGAQAGIDVSDLRRNTQYGGVYQIGDDGLEHPSVRHFWKVMESLPDVDRRKVLKFVTSTPRGPLLGFSNLNPRFSIRDSSSDEGRIPTASTCVNLLKLPMYRSEKALRDKLLYAVNSGAGFDLS